MEISKDTRRAGYFIQLIDAAIQLQDAFDAMLELRSESSIERSDLDHVRAVLNTAQERSSVARGDAFSHRGMKVPVTAAS
jgi:hypothetical protein